MRLLRRSLLLAAMAVGFCGWGHAQDASLHGTVIIPTGAPIQRAHVVATGRGVVQTATTDESGKYVIGGLAAGVYSVRVSAAGYEAFEVQATLTRGLDQQIDAVLIALPVSQEPAPNPAESPAAIPVEAAPATTATPQVAAVMAQAVPVKPPKGKAALYGLVTDQTGAVVESATATATGGANPPPVTPNPQGQYTVNGLAPGNYKLKVSAPGFSVFETDVALLPDQALEIDVSLQPASTTTNVEVVGHHVAEVETETNQIEGTITNKEVVSTGLNGRNFTQLIALAPGVSNQTGQDEARVGLSGSVKYSVNGGRVEYNNFDIDGSDVLNAGLNGAESTLMVYPSLDAIQEVKVLTSNYGAMYGRSASGTVLVTTKSGTPTFHGGAYEFLRNEFFNARNYFDQTTKAPLYRRQDFGFNVGGPLFIPGVFNTKKDKTFFFFSEEFRYEKSPLGPGGSTDFNQAVPTNEERSGNFSDVCPFAPGNAVVDFQRANFPDCPAFGGAISGSGFRTFPGNQVSIDPRSSVLLNTGLIPTANSQIGCNSSLAGKPDPITGVPLVPCYSTVISPSTYWREELFRIDHNITQNVRASFRYIHDSWNTTVVTPQWGYIQSNSFPTVENKLTGPGISMVARLTDTISPTLLNEFVVSYVDAHITLQDVGGPGANLNPGVITRGHTPPCINVACNPQYPGNVGYIFNNGFDGKLPGLVIGGTNLEYGGTGFAVDTSYMPWDHTNPTYSLSDNLSKAWGKHTVQFGVQVVNSQRNETNAAEGAATGDQQGLFTFSNQNSVLTTGNAFADFLYLNPVNGYNPIKSFQQDSSQLKYYNDYWVIEPYVQDDWRVSRHLNLSLGVRLSLFGNYHEKNLNAYNWEESAFNRSLAATVQINSGTAAGLDGGYLETLSRSPITVDPNNPGSLNPVLTNGLVQCGKNGIPSSCMSRHLFNPAPRIGFAWDPKGDGKTSIRGGYGIFFEHGTGQEANTGSLQGSAPLVLTMTSPFPSAFDTVGIGQNGSAFGSSLAYPLDVTSIPTKTVWPYVQQWSLSAQRQLPKNMLATVAYVGSKGTHLTAELQLNQLAPLSPALDTGIFPIGNPFPLGAPLTSATCTSFNNGIPGSFTVAQNGFIVTPGQPAWTNLVASCYGDGSSSAIPPPNSLRTYAPSFDRVLSLQNIADSSYHALQATLRRTSGPFTVGVSYTYSHSFDDSSDRSDASFVNSANIKSSWASSNFDQRHLLSVNYVYELPHISRAVHSWLVYDSDSPTEAKEGTTPSSSPQSGVTHILLDGWQISGITAFQSGTPFSVVNGGSGNGISVLDNAGVANGAGAGSYPDVAGDPRAPLNTPGVTRFNPGSIGPLLYNPEAFVAPRGLTFGNSGRNFLNNPHRLNFDLSLLKNFKITEGSQLEFRFEGFNVFNHTQFRIFDPNLGNSANNTASCYGGQNYSAAGGLTTFPGFSAPPVQVDCTTGSSFLHPVDAHRPRTMQLGLKYTF